MKNNHKRNAARKSSPATLKTAPITEPHKCNICKQSFLTKAKLLTHKQSFHKGQYSFECELCGKTYNHQSNLNRHKAVHKEKPQDTLETEDDLKCKICNKHFSSKSNITKHIKVVHRQIRQFNCEWCTNSFTVKGNLKRHVLRAHRHIIKA